MRLSLKNKFLLPTLAIIVLGMGLTNYISHNRAKAALVRAFDAQIEQIAAGTGTVVKTWIHDRKLDVRSWSEQKIFNDSLKDTFLGKAARKSANTTLEKLKKDYVYYENIALAGTNGELLASADPTHLTKNINVTDRDYFKAAMQDREFITDVVVSKGSGKPVVILSAPVREKEAVVGVLFGVVDILHFSDTFIAPIKVGETGYAYIYDKSGMVFAHPQKDLITQINMNDFDFGRHMLKQGSGWFTYVFKDVEKKVYFEQMENLGWTLAVGANTAEIEAPVKSLGMLNLMVGLIVLAAAAVVVLLLVRSMVNPINRIAGELDQGAEQVDSAAVQVSAASQSLAEGSSEQAASIEETSSSLEEMASMTRQNADNANHADTLMREVKTVVQTADESMDQMTLSMDEITKASENTSKIIKTIDEIAFQTNLLALNAAVEAARAGEAGAGFAVVADEVRNLAMRAAQAAKDTSELIEGTTKRVKEGADLVARTNEAFAQVTQSASKVADLVGEIATASTEQSKGIDQINGSVTEMDKIVQQNAANAEESASASEEMSAQAKHVKAMVEELAGIVTGSRQARNQTKDKVSGKSRGKSAERPGKYRSSASSPVKTRSAEKTSAMDPEQIIPFEDDGDFKDF